MRFAGALLRTAVRVLAWTWRIDVIGVEHLQRLRRERGAGRGMVFALWHRELVPLIWQHRHEGVTLLVSEHTDGGRLSAAAQPLGYRVIRGSSTRGALRGLLGLIRTLRGGGEIALATDGPRGPVGTVKPGAVAAAQRAGAAVLAVAASATPAWTAGSWDRLLVPLPFARIRIAYAPPLEVAPGAAALTAARQTLQERLEWAAACARSA